MRPQPPMTVSGRLDCSRAERGERRDRTACRLKRVFRRSAYQAEGQTSWTGRCGGGGGGAMAPALAPDADELRSLTRTAPDPRVRRRAHARLLVPEGRPVAAVPRLFETGPHRGRAWRARCLAGGRLPGDGYHRRDPALAGSPRGGPGSVSPPSPGQDSRGRECEAWYHLRRGREMSVDCVGVRDGTAG